MARCPSPILLFALSTLLALPAWPKHSPAQTCLARSAERSVQLVELYTSEGCNACPPADRWLSTLQGRPGVLAAAFHVDYWDRLGWVDRFGDARFTARQAGQVRSAGARFAYTPQVLVNGRDWRGWPTLPWPVAAPAPVHITLQRLDAGPVVVVVTALRGAPPRLAGWWALLEDGHQSAVGAGENRGATLRHDHVVRRYGPLPAWPAPVNGPVRLAPLDAPHNGEGGHKARLLVVVTDAVTGVPLQAV